MIEDSELKALLQDIESDRVERTRSRWDVDKFSEAICAFANDLPGHRKNGYLIIGADDRTGQPVGINVDNELMTKLGDLRRQGNVLPQPSLNVAKFSLDGGDVAIVEVIPHNLPPVRYKGFTYIRIGPRKGIASAQDERILIERRISSAKTFDALPCLESKLDDLVLDLFTLNYRPEAIASEVIAENKRSIEQQLASLRFYDTRHNCPTNAGILLFGQSPLQWIPGAYIQFVHYEGIDQSSNVLDEKRISGDLLTVLRELDGLIALQVTTTLHQETALREKEVYNYPIIALRELIINAVIHRDYESNAPVRFYRFSDHIEIQNPGGLYGAAIYNFPQQNDYRNQILAEAAHNLGYVNKFGRGVIRAKEELLRNGSPEPIYTFEGGYVAVTVMERA